MFTLLVITGSEADGDGGAAIALSCTQHRITIKTVNFNIKALRLKKNRQNRLKTIKPNAKEYRPYTCSFSFQDKNSEMPKKGICKR